MDYRYLIKKLVRILFLPFMLLNTYSCSAEKTPPYVHYSDTIVRMLEQEMNEKYGLSCIGKGGNLNGGVKKLSLDFIGHYKVTIDQAREIEINATERFLYLINSHEKIRPYLKEYPFTRDSIQVTLAFYKPDGHYYLDDWVAFAFTGKDKIFYCKAELVKRKKIPVISTDGKPLPAFMNDPTERIEEVLAPLKDEPYEEALKIVKESPSCLKEIGQN